MSAVPLLANTRGQLLTSHCALVGVLARHIVESTYGNAQHWGRAAMVGGFFHDIGKAEPEFVRFLTTDSEAHIEEADGTHIADSAKTKGFSFNAYPRHNEVSWMLLATWVDEAAVRQSGVLNGNAQLWECVKHVVYWHHAKPVREEPGNFALRSQLFDFVRQWAGGCRDLLAELIREIFLKAGEPYNLSLVAESLTDREEPVPEFKKRYARLTSDTLNEVVRAEAMRSAVRAAIVCADRIVSAYSAEELEAWLEVYRVSGELPAFLAERQDKDALLMAQIKDMIERFDGLSGSAVRNKQQADAAWRLQQAQQSVLQGPAGCGKTKIMLEYIGLQQGARTFIFVPRTAIGQGLFKELVEEYRICANVELLTGDVREISDTNGIVSCVEEGQELQGQVVITTIDQICNIALGHRKIDLLTDVMNSTVIVDEFHELMDIAGVVVMFLELMCLRAMTRTASAKTLLVSATPNPFFVKLLADLDISGGARLLDNVVEVPTFNEKPIHVEFNSFVADKALPHPFQKLSTPGDIAVANTATVAQRAALSCLATGTPVICFHSKFTPRDKKLVLSAVLKHFSKNASASEKLLLSGPIVQASLNITTRHLHSEACHAENCLQRIGRLNRFGTFESSTFTVYDLIEKGTPGHADKQLAKLKQFKRTQAWLDWLRSYVRNNNPVTLQGLYDEYTVFHGSADTEAQYQEDFEQILKDSANTFDKKIFDPIQYPAVSAAKGAKDKKLSARSLRGNSYFVLPLSYEIKEDKLVRQRWLFNESSPAEERLTDDLRRVMYSDDAQYGEVKGYLTSKEVECLHWTQQLPVALRKAFGRRKPKFRGFSHWASFARSHDTPVVLSFPGVRPAAMPYYYAYLTKDGVPLGLVHEAIWVPPVA